MWKVLAILVTGLLLGGCAAMSTLPVASLLPAAASGVDMRSQTAIRLEEDNFKVIKTNAVGRCKGFALLGFITIAPAKFSKAMDRLYAQAELEAGRPQTLVNIVMERSRAFFILFSIPEVSVRGDVVEFVVRPETEAARGAGTDREAGAAREASSDPEARGSVHR